MSAERARTTHDKARELQRTLYRAAKASPTRRFHALYDKMYREDVLSRAWQEVKTNAGAAGVDKQTIEQIEQRGVEGFLAELATELREGRYRPHAVRRAWIPKADGRRRGLGIPHLAGPVAGLFESGSITRAAFEFAQAHAIGTSLWVSVGNGSVVATMDILEYLLEDDATRAIVLFLESLREPERFKRLAQQALELHPTHVASWDHGRQRARS